MIQWGPTSTRKGIFMCLFFVLWILPNEGWGCLHSVSYSEISSSTCDEAMLKSFMQSKSIESWVATRAGGVIGSFDSKSYFPTRVYFKGWIVISLLVNVGAIKCFIFVMIVLILLLVSWTRNWMHLVTYLKMTKIWYGSSWSRNLHS